MGVGKNRTRRVRGPYAKRACVRCHKAKAKCDNKRPCRRCNKLGMAHECVDFVPARLRTGNEVRGKRKRKRSSRTSNRQRKRSSGRGNLVEMIQPPPPPPPKRISTRLGRKQSSHRKSFTRKNVSQIYPVQSYLSNLRKIPHGGKPPPPPPNPPQNHKSTAPPPPPPPPPDVRSQSSQNMYNASHSSPVFSEFHNDNEYIGSPVNTFGMDDNYKSYKPDYGTIMPYIPQSTLSTDLMLHHDNYNNLQQRIPQPPPPPNSGMTEDVHPSGFDGLTFYNEDEFPILGLEYDNDEIDEDHHHHHQQQQQQQQQPSDLDEEEEEEEIPFYSMDMINEEGNDPRSRLLDSPIIDLENSHNNGGNNNNDDEPIITAISPGSPASRQHNNNNNNNSHRDDNNNNTGDIFHGTNFQSHLNPFDDPLTSEDLFFPHHDRVNLTQLSPNGNSSSDENNNFNILNSSSGFNFLGNVDHVENHQYYEHDDDFV